MSNHRTQYEMTEKIEKLCALMWVFGADTQEIAINVAMPEHVIAGRLDGIKAAARDMRVTI